MIGAQHSARTLACLLLVGLCMQTATAQIGADDFTGITLHERTGGSAGEGGDSSDDTDGGDGVVPGGSGTDGVGPGGWAETWQVAGAAGAGGVLSHAAHVSRNLAMALSHQTGADNDSYVVVQRVAQVRGRHGQSHLLRRVALFDWILGEQVVGQTIAVGERPIGPFAADTELHRFTAAARIALKLVDFDSTPLKMRKADVARFPSTIAANDKFTATNPRTYVVASTRTVLTWSEADETYVFHVVSATRGGARIDHFLEISFEGDAIVPLMRWFVDAGSYKRLTHLASDPSHEDWEVRPVDERMTPVPHAMGYEMVPHRPRPNVRRHPRLDRPVLPKWHHRHPLRPMSDGPAGR